jgi:hypothetical protein
MSGGADNPEARELDVVEPLPERTVLSLLPGLPMSFDTGSLAGLVQSVGTTSGNAQQTAPIVQGLTSTPQLPTP